MILDHANDMIGLRPIPDEQIEMYDGLSRRPMPAESEQQ
jgi:hypothetical protein